MRSVITSFILLLFIACSCNNTVQQEKKNKETIPSFPVIHQQQSELINWFASTRKEDIVMISTAFRNRYFSQSDFNSLKTILGQNDAIDQYQSMVERAKDKTVTLLYDSTYTYRHIKWVKDEDIKMCREVLRDLWPCFKNRYNGDHFLYLSEPVFSADKKWCLMSVNKSHATKGESSGGGRLFHHTQKGWEETAFLSYWGKEPE